MESIGCKMLCPFRAILFFYVLILEGIAWWLNF